MRDTTRRALKALRDPDPTLGHTPGTVRHAIADVIEDQHLAIRAALKALDGASPKHRNGPVYKAADTLRRQLGLSPMEIGANPSDGMDDE